VGCDAGLYSQRIEVYLGPALKRHLSTLHAAQRTNRVRTDHP